MWYSSMDQINIVYIAVTNYVWVCWRVPKRVIPGLDCCWDLLLEWSKEALALATSLEFTRLCVLKALRQNLVTLSLCWKRSSRQSVIFYSQVRNVFSSCLSRNTGFLVLAISWKPLNFEKLILWEIVMTPRSVFIGQDYLQHVWLLFWVSFAPLLSFCATERIADKWINCSCERK